MHRTLYASVVFSLVAQTAHAQPNPLASICGKAGMRPYPAVNDGLGAGTVYYDARNFEPTPAGIICSGVFDGMEKREQTAVKATLIPGSETGSKDLNAKFGLQFLKGILGPANDAKVDASVAKGDTWKVSTGALMADGQTGLGLIRFGTSGACLQEIKKSLGKKQQIEVMLVYQSARTPELAYTVTNNRGGGAGIGINLGDLISINPSFSTKKQSATELKVDGLPVNVCYAAKKYRLSPGTGVGPGNFILRPI